MLYDCYSKRNIATCSLAKRHSREGINSVNQLFITKRRPFSYFFTYKKANKTNVKQQCMRHRLRLVGILIYQKYTHL